MTPEERKGADGADGLLLAEQRVRLEEAAWWSAHLEDEPSAGNDAAFITWVSNPKNQRALQDLNAAWRLLADEAASPELVTLRRAALADAERSVRGRRRQVRRWEWGLAAGLAAATLLVIGYFTFLPISTYATAIGERRTITLADGSRLSLDSDSDVTVRYSWNARTLVLRRGRCRFDVAHDPARPFTVSAGREEVVAVGTAFNVERLGDTVLVTLLKGKVTVGPIASGGAVSGPASAVVRLTAGEQLTAAGDTAPTVSPADLQAATAWESGRLDFDDAPLSEVVARVNRYALQPIALDPTVASLRVSGVFTAGDVPAFVDAITAYLPLSATTDHGRITLHAAH